MFAYFDIGGTKTRVALSHDGTAFGDVTKFDTPHSFEEGVHLVASTIRTQASGAALHAVGGGMAGPLDREKTMLVRAPNLPDWAGKPFASALGAELSGVPVFLENDSALVALGEAHYGAGKGDPIMAYITVSTGVGGARIVDGHIDKSAYGFEPGHQTFDLDKTLFPGLTTGEAEEIVSGTATATRFGKPAYEVTDPAVWEELAGLLACMLNNTIVHWSPHSVVLGGSMIVGDPAIPVDRVTYHLARICTIYPELPSIKRAALADRGGIYGAMVYVAQRLSA